jgi:malate synthase
MSITTANGYQVADALHHFIEQEALPGSGITSDSFWSGLAAVMDEFNPRTAAVLAKRDALQKTIDDWHIANPGKPELDSYKTFLTDIGYLVPKPAADTVSLDRVDPEIAQIAGPQLVVPVNNARYALNAANARWGSLYDALYGTDAISEDDGAERSGGYNPVRGQRVIAWANQFLNKAAPLAQGDYADVKSFALVDGALQATLTTGSVIGLRDASQCVGYQGTTESPSIIVLKRHGLHIELHIDRNHPVGQDSPSGTKDVWLESALSTIQDCEDSVAAVDAEDKVVVYRNWLGLMTGQLQESFEKGGKTIIRSLNPDRVYIAIDGSELRLPGRSVQLVRNVGQHLKTDAVLTPDGEEVHETLLDALVTCLCATHDFAKSSSEPRNSRTGSMYVVKPKMHGPEEVALAVDLFARVEKIMDLPKNTMKIGIMDEERRTSVNLEACILAAKERVIFINTGFLDRTGDEMHTSMHAGLMVPKGEMKNATWLSGYENNNVDVGLRCGLRGNGQIGKGMWAMPDQMADMLATKQGHPLAGATTAWVPSPTAATLHATHYHEVSVAERQEDIAGRTPTSVDTLLEIPLAEAGRNFSDEEIQLELDNNAQGILGYVVRWINNGVGCSKVPDINNVGLMEDRATLRISSQLLANWLQHELISVQQVRDTMERMALVVDEQNENDPEYTSMAPDFDASVAFQAALELVLEGRDQANGYTEFVLTRRRRERKAQLAS